MGRTRSALLAATAECVARYGVRKTTMVDVASKSRVAKATLYNHFRTKDDVLAALVEQQVGALIDACVGAASGQGLEAALILAAQRLAASADEPALLAPLMVLGSGRGWTAAREGAAAVLTAAGARSDAAAVDVLLRWVTSQVLWPVPADSVTSAAAAAAAGLSGTVAADVGSRQVAAYVVAPPVPTLAPRAGLGWPQ
jgi:AcrR family transcriptional regulator